MSSCLFQRYRIRRRSTTTNVTVTGVQKGKRCETFFHAPYKRRGSGTENAPSMDSHPSTGLKAFLFFVALYASVRLAKLTGPSSVKRVEQKSLDFRIEEHAPQNRLFNTSSIHKFSKDFQNSPRKFNTQTSYGLRCDEVLPRNKGTLRTLVQ
uniref:Secreted protein n=1 Tax=Steinernema glaseri TaxID=37863 RepID=A0A1I8AEZ9_9BILA